MQQLVAKVVLVFVLVETASAAIFNQSGLALSDNFLKENNLTGIQTRRQSKRKHESTSSSGSRANGRDADERDESLNEKFTEESSTDTDEKGRGAKKKARTPKSSAERKGWRKWHRKCTKCVEDMHKKWRDPSIKWICGAYQRARRTFKSMCMMHYRNCQDGTMFTKIADHKCPNGSSEIRPYNLHFFYDYNVVLSDESSDSGSKTESESTEESTSLDTSAVEKLPPFEFVI